MSHENPFAAPADSEFHQRQITPLKPPQTVRFDFLMDDYLALNAHLQAHSTTLKSIFGRRRRQLVVLAVVMSGLAVLWSLSLGRGPLTYLFVFLALFYLSLGLKSPQRIARQSQKINRQLFEESGGVGLFGKRTVTIDAEQIEETEQAGAATRKWWAIQNVAQTDQHLFLFLAPANAFIVPARAFVDEAAFAAFCDLAERLWKAGQATRPDSVSN